MLKILLAILIVIEILLVPLIIYFFSGVTIALPGLGLVISGALVSTLLLFVEVILIFISVLIYRNLPLDPGAMP